MSLISEFKDFINKGNMVEMAVGIVIGGVFGKVINSIVDDLIMPPIGYVLGGTNFSDMKMVLKDGVAEIKDAAGKVTTPAVPEIALKYGSFIQVLIVFLITAFCVFLIAKAYNKMKKAEAEAPAAPTATETLLTEIRDSLKK